MLFLTVELGKPPFQHIDQTEPYKVHLTSLIVL